MITAIIAGSSSSAALLDGSQPPSRAALSILLDWIDVDYGGPPRGQGVVLRGEPIVLDIGVVNAHQGPAVAAETDWPQRITGHLRQGGRFESSGSTIPLTCAAQFTRSSRASVVDDYLRLESDGFQSVRCQIDQNVVQLTGGQYTVTVDWSEQADFNQLKDAQRVPGLPSALRGILEFEFREVVTDDDRIDLWNHLAVRAKRANDASRALQLVEQVLRQRQHNTTALYLRGEIRASMGQCKEAIDDFERVAMTIERSLDGAHRRYRDWSASERMQQANGVRERGRLTTCP